MGFKFQSTVSLPAPSRDLCLAQVYDLCAVTLLHENASAAILDALLVQHDPVTGGSASQKVDVELLLLS